MKHFAKQRQAFFYLTLFVKNESFYSSYNPHPSVGYLRVKKWQKLTNHKQILYSTVLEIFLFLLEILVPA